MNTSGLYDRAPSHFSEKSLTTPVTGPKSHFQKAEPLLWIFHQENFSARIFHILPSPLIYSLSKAALIKSKLSLCQIANPAPGELHWQLIDKLLGWTGIQSKVNRTNQFIYLFIYFLASFSSIFSWNSGNQRESCFTALTLHLTPGGDNTFFSSHTTALHVSVQLAHTFN